MHQNYKYTHLTKEEIFEKAKAENIPLNFLQLSNEIMIFFPGWTFSLNNGVLVAESEYDKFIIKESNYDILVKTAEQTALQSAIKNSGKIKSELYIYLLYRLYLNWQINSIIFDSGGYAWKIHVAKQKICWNKHNKFIAIESIKYRGLFKILAKKMAIKIPLSQAAKIAETIISICFAKNKNRLRIASRIGLVINAEMHPDDKKAIAEKIKDDKEKKAKVEMAKSYEGFAVENGGRGGYLFYKQNGKIIVAYWEASYVKSDPDYSCLDVDLEKWTYPEEKTLTTEEKNQLLADMNEYNNNHKQKIGIVKGLSLEELVADNKKSSTIE